MGALSQIEVSQGYQYVLKMLASCYFALKYSFSHKLIFVIFPCSTQFTFPSVFLLNHSRKHSHSFIVWAPNLGAIPYCFLFSPTLKNLPKSFCCCLFHIIHYHIISKTRLCTIVGNWRVQGK